MSRVLINQYYNNLDRAIQFGKSTNEQSVRMSFWILLNDYARKQNYEVVPEVACMGTKGKKVCTVSVETIKIIKQMKTKTFKLIREEKDHA